MDITVTIEITAVKFKRLNSFEWAILSLLDSFRGDVPTIAVATKELCIGEPAFLSSALGRLRDKDAVKAITDEQRVLDLNDFEITENGLLALRDDGIEVGEPEFFCHSFPLNWPSLHLLSHRADKIQKSQGEMNVSSELIQQRLTADDIANWINRPDEVITLRVKEFLVTSIEG